MIKKILLVVVAVAAIGAGFFFWYRTTQANIGSLNIYNGSVEIVRSSSGTQGKTGQGIKAKDVLKVGDNSRVSIVLKDGSVVRLEAGSEVVVEELEYEGRKLKDALFKVNVGKMWSKVQPLDQDAQWEVETPTVVAAVRGTAFNTRYSDASTGVSVFQGKVGVALTENRLNERLLVEGNAFRVSDATPEEDFTKDPAVVVHDEWVLFNLGEDFKIDGSTRVDENTNASTTEDMTMDVNASSTEQTATTTPAVLTPPAPAPTPTPTPTPPAPTPTPPPTAPTNAVKSITISTPKTTITTGEQIFFKLTATYNDGTTQNITNGAKWLQSSENGSFSGNFYKAIIEGTTRIKADFQGAVSNEITITIQKPVAKTLSRIAVSYVKNSPPPNLTYYQPPTAHFTATGYYSDGTTANITNQVTWSASGSAEGSINSSGYYTPGGYGTDTVTATSGNVTGSTTISYANPNS